MDRFTLDADNMPLARPGIYMLLHNASGRCYVGMSKNIKRRMGQYSRGYSSGRIGRAIKKYGRSEFTVIPLFYMFHHDADYLLKIEAQLIARYSAFGPRGFNLLPASKGVQMWTPEFAKAVSESIKKKFADPEWGPKRRIEVSDFFKTRWANPTTRDKMVADFVERTQTPEARAKRLQALVIRSSDPAHRQRIGNGVRAASRSPEAKEKRAKATSANWEKPEYRHKMQAKKGNGDAMRVRWQDPEYRTRMVAAHTRKPQSAETITKRTAKLRASWGNPSEKRKAYILRMSGTRCVNNGIKSKMIPAGAAIPDGWFHGRLPSSKVRQRKPRIKRE